jgi:hypothetical protein
VRAELDGEQVAHLAVEVGEAGLGPRENADLDIALVAEVALPGLPAMMAALIAPIETPATRFG